MTDAVVTLDRSKAFSTVHGERTPGDPHYGVHFFQDGLPFNAGGELMMDKVPSELRELAARKVEKVKAQMASTKGAAGDGGASTSGGPPMGDPNDVNLEAYLRGRMQYQWFAIVAAVRNRYHTTKQGKKDLIAFLVEEIKLIPRGEVAPDLLAEIGG